MNQPHSAKHICNSHKPMLKPKIAKELVCLPSLFCRRKKQNWGSAILKRIAMMKKTQQVTTPMCNVEIRL